MTEPPAAAGEGTSGKRSDFRQALYGRYVSDFKSWENQGSVLDTGWLTAEYRHLYLPLLAPTARDSPILDLGCGRGELVRFLREAGFTNAEGVDTSEEQVRVAAREGLPVRVGDVFQFLQDRSGYGAILAIDVLEHFSKDELLRLVPLICGALREDGLLLIRTPNAEGLFPADVLYGDLTHLTPFTPGSLSQLLRLFGFTDMHFKESGPVPLGLRGRLRAVAWRIITGAASIIRRIETGHAQQVWTENMVCWARKAPGDRRAE